MSVEELFIRGNAIWGTVLPGNVCLENCPFGELSAGQMSSGKCLSGKCPSKKVRVGKVRRKTVLQPAKGIQKSNSSDITGNQFIFNMYWIWNSLKARF